MIINATLLVQICNFGIMYFVLTRVLLYPAARMVEREDAVRDKILQDIATLQQRKTDYVRFRDQQWSGCVASLAARKPSGPYCTPFTTYAVEYARDIEIDVGSELTQQLRDTIVQEAHGDGS